MSPTVAELLLQRLELVGAEAGLCSLDVAAALGVDHQVLVGAVKSLQSLGEVNGWRAEEEEEVVPKDCGDPAVRVARGLGGSALPQC